MSRIRDSRHYLLLILEYWRRKDTWEYLRAARREPLIMVAGKEERRALLPRRRKPKPPRLHQFPTNTIMPSIHSRSNNVKDTGRRWGPGDHGFESLMSLFSPVSNFKYGICAAISLRVVYTQSIASRCLLSVSVERNYYNKKWFQRIDGVVSSESRGRLIVVI